MCFRRLNAWMPCAVHGIVDLPRIRFFAGLREGDLCTKEPVLLQGYFWRFAAAHAWLCLPPPLPVDSAAELVCSEASSLFLENSCVSWLSALLIFVYPTRAVFRPVVRLLEEGARAHTTAEVACKGWCQSVRRCWIRELHLVICRGSLLPPWQ